MSNPLMSAGTSEIFWGRTTFPTAFPSPEIVLPEISSINPVIFFARSGLLPIILLKSSLPSISENICPARLRSSVVASGLSAMFTASPISSKLAPVANLLAGIRPSSSTGSCRQYHPLFPAVLWAVFPLPEHCFLAAFQTGYSVPATRYKAAIGISR